MKNLLTVIIISSIIAACSSKRNDYKCLNEEYLITKIDSVDDYFVIYVKQSSQNYKLISEKKRVVCSGKIEVGKKYCLKTESIFNFKIKNKDSVYVISNSVNIDCILFGNIQVCKEYDKGIFDVLETKDLQGLCFDKASNNAK